jgi:F-type H+-transporting ATPase subunit b
MRRLVAPFVAVVAALSIWAMAPAALAAEPEPEHAAEAAHEGGEHEGAEHEDQEFNWAFGFLGEKDGEAPSLLYRPKGMAPPFLANILNAVVLFGIIIAAGRKPIAEGLKKRKENLVGAMQEASRMKEEAEKTLAQYEKKLAHIDDEIERIRKEMRESAEAERKRILADAKERRERMERDAKLLVLQEQKAAREALLRETVARAMKSAEELLEKQLAASDHDRIAREFLETVKKAPIQGAGAGGRS